MSTGTTVVCASCGQTTTVPFEPRGDRPVYCKSCYRPKQGVGAAVAAAGDRAAAVAAGAVGEPRPGSPAPLKHFRFYAAQGGAAKCGFS